MTTTIKVDRLTVHQRWHLRRWLVDDLVPELLPLVGIVDSDGRPWGSMAPAHGRVRLHELWEQARARGRYPDHQADLLLDLMSALSGWSLGLYETALDGAQRAVSHLANHPNDRRDARRFRQRWTAAMEAVLALPEPPVVPVGTYEIAKMAHVEPDTVDKWRRRHPDFPQPRWPVGTRPAWDAGDVERWLAANGRPYTPAAEQFPFR